MLEDLVRLESEKYENNKKIYVDRKLIKDCFDRSKTCGPFWSHKMTSFLKFLRPFQSLEILL